MKRLFFILIVCLIYSCNFSQKDEPAFNPRNKNYKDFVYIDANTFKIADTAFFPMMVNYKVEPLMIDSNVVISPAKYYEYTTQYEYDSKDSIMQQMSAHFQLMKDLGFNTIRVCMDVLSKDVEGYYYHSSKPVYLKKHNEKILQALDELLSIAQSMKLRIMLLVKSPLDKELMDFTISVMKRFSENSTLFCYDFMNEPLYFDPAKERNKYDAQEIVAEWKCAMDKYAPHQLFTIGFSEPIEVFEWDPFIMPVDFVQFHTYHPLRVPNEIWWYSHYIGKPWIVGETSFSVDNDSLPYEMQTYFMKEVFQYALNCGASGFGWWEFQDAYDVHFEAQYSGLMNHEGRTKTSKGEYIIGSLKPAAYEVNNLKKYTPQKEWRAVNYYNMLGYDNILLKGTILEKETKQPIEGAVIRGWNENWSIGLNTYTDENGEFTLYSNDVCVHFEISAPGMSKIKFDSVVNYTVVTENYSLDSLPNKNLEYHDISYKPFLMNDTTLFVFKSDMFDKAKMEGILGVFYLEKMK